MILANFRMVMFSYISSEQATSEAKTRHENNGLPKGSKGYY